MKFKHRYIRQWHKSAVEAGVVDSATEAVELLVNDAYNGPNGQVESIIAAVEALTKLVGAMLEKMPEDKQAEVLDLFMFDTVP